MSDFIHVFVFSCVHQCSFFFPQFCDVFKLWVYVFHVLGVTRYGTTIILVKLWQKGSCVHPN